MSGEVLNLESTLSDDRKNILATYNIDITINNRSKVGFSKAEVAVKDNESNTAQTAYFGRIEPGRSDTRTVTMPGGVDWVLYRIWPDIGEPVTGVGTAVNAPGVNINITD